MLRRRRQLTVSVSKQLALAKALCITFRLALKTHTILHVRWSVYYYLSDRSEVSHLNIDIQEAAFGNLKHEAHLCAGVDPLVEALLGMGVYANEVAGRSGGQDGQQDNQLRHGKHVLNVW